MKRSKDKTETVIGCIGLLIFGAWAAFWIGIIYIAWHCISKLW